MKKISLVIVLVGLFFMLIFSSSAKSKPKAVATALPVDYSALVSVQGGTYI